MKKLHTLMPRSWILADEQKVGTHRQCQGLALALGIELDGFKTIAAKFPWKYLPSRWWLSPLCAVHHQGLDEPWPELIISGGRQSAAPALEIRKKSGCKVIFLQRPDLDISEFDLVIAPTHDRLEGQNVLHTTGALHTLCHEDLKTSAAAFRRKIPKDLKKPFTAVLIGGDSRHYKYRLTDMENLANHLKAFAWATKGSLLITASRRTRPELIFILHELLRDTPHYIWDGQGENPYVAFLGLASHVIVTSDSISMTSEACYTGVPVFVEELPVVTPKFRRFLDELYRKDHARRLRGALEVWDVVALDEMSRIIPLIREKLGLPSL